MLAYGLIYLFADIILNILELEKVQIILQKLSLIDYYLSCNNTIF